MAQVYHLSSGFSVLYCRVRVASKDADEARREKAVAENLMEELRRRCSSLEKEKCEALEKLKESIEAVNIAKMQKTQVIQFFSVSLFRYLISSSNFSSISYCAASKQAARVCLLILLPQALLREKQGAEVLDKTQECCSRLIRETPVRIRKEVGDSMSRKDSWLEISTFSTKYPPSDEFVLIQSYLDQLWTIGCLDMHFGP